MISYSIKYETDRVSSLKRADISAAPAVRILLRDTLRGIKMKQIKLTQGYIALVDDEDFERLNQPKWQVKHGYNCFYAYRTVGRKNKHGIFMHREIMDLKKGDKKQVDHINHNGLDNRKCNLRVCTNQQNHMNTCSRQGTSLYKGVCWFRRDNLWFAQIKVGLKQRHLGYFSDEIQAAKAYDKAALRHFGEFAKPNFNYKENDCVN